MNLNPKTIIGDTSEPNTVWIAMGRIFGVAGLAMLGGFEAMGVAIAQTTSIVAGGTILSGLGMMAYGTQLKKNRVRAQQQHEIKLRRSERQKPEPSNLDNQFLAWFSSQSLPVTRAWLVSNPFPKDVERSHNELAASSTIRRADFWFEHGKIRREGDTYTLRDNTDSTVYRE